MTLKTAGVVLKFKVKGEHWLAKFENTEMFIISDEPFDLEKQNTEYKKKTRL